MGYLGDQEKERIAQKKLALSSMKWGTAVFVGLVILGMMGCPQYNVYRSRKAGEASLAHAQYSKEVAVAEAKAKMESAVYEAQADTLRAVGVARSNQIIGQSLNNNESYLKWLWIDNMVKNQNAVIYVPTEANLPILEATRNQVITHPVQ